MISDSVAYILAIEPDYICVLSEKQENLFIKQAEIVNVNVEDGKVKSIAG